MKETYCQLAAEGTLTLQQLLPDQLRHVSSQVWKGFKRQDSAASQAGETRVKAVCSTLYETRGL